MKAHVPTQQETFLKGYKAGFSNATTIALLEIGRAVGKEKLNEIRKKMQDTAIAIQKEGQDRDKAKADLESFGVHLVEDTIHTK